MKNTFTGIFDTYAAGVRAVRELEIAGIPHDDISLVANNADSRDLEHYSTFDEDHRKVEDAAVDVASDEPTGAAMGASVGTATGAGVGLLAGLGMLAIPGIGPVVAAGWLVATAVGAGIGAGTGSLIGALTESGVKEEHAEYYADQVKSGSTIVTVRADQTQQAVVEDILKASGDKSSLTAISPLDRKVSDSDII